MFSIWVVNCLRGRVGKVGALDRKSRLHQWSNHTETFKKGLSGGFPATPLGLKETVQEIISPVLVFCDRMVKGL